MPAEMDLPFYADFPDSTVPHGEPDYLDTHTFSGYESLSKFPGGGDNYLSIAGGGHPFLSSSETFHTPSLGDEEFEIPPISLDPDSALTVSDVVSHFGEMSEGVTPAGVTVNPVVGTEDPSFASTFVSTPTQGLDHLSLGVISQSEGSTLLSSTMGMDLGHHLSSQFSGSSPVTIDVPLSDMNHSLLGHNQLTTIDQSELNAQLGLSLGGGAILPHPQSPEPPLSATPSPAGSLQDEDMDDFRQKSMLVDSPVSLSDPPAVISLSPSLADSPLPSFSGALTAGLRKGGGAAGTGKKGKKKKDPNEPQKPVSAYALFFRDTQAAIKGQNPNATFGEVSKIVASMWDSLGEEQKQVYKRKTETAKTEYLKALAAYKASQVSQTAVEVIDVPPSPHPVPSPVPLPAPTHTPALTRATRIPHHAPEQNTITNICTSNIILDLPQVTTRSRTGAHKAAVATTPTSTPPNAPSITKIIISKQSLVQQSLGVVLPDGRSARQPPPLQQMQATPPPPRLQQMVHAPPPLQAKPRGGGAVSVTTAPPPPLQIKIVPVQAELTSPLIVTTTTAAVAMETVQGHACSLPAEGAVTEEMEVELNVSPVPEDTPTATQGAPIRCVRAGCPNAPVENKDWDKEYCSNECVATHCRDVFMAWCAIRSSNSTTVT